MPVNNCRQYYCASSSALPRFWCCQVCKGTDIFLPSRSCRQPCRERLDCSMLPVGSAHRICRQEVRPVTVDAVFFSYAQRSVAVRCAQVLVVLSRPDMHCRVFKTLARWLAAHDASGICLYLCARWQCPKLHRVAVTDAYAWSVRILGEGNNVIIAYFASSGGEYQKTCLA